MPPNDQRVLSVASGRVREGIIPSRPPEASFLFPFPPNPIVNRP
jgi:hypothetical protein